MKSRNGDKKKHENEMNFPSKSLAVIQQKKKKKIPFNWYKNKANKAVENYNNC